MSPTVGTSVLDTHSSRGHISSISSLALNFVYFRGPGMFFTCGCLHSLSITSLSWAKKGVYVAGTGTGGGGGRGDDDDDDGGGAATGGAVDCALDDDVEGGVLDGGCGRGQLCLDLQVFMCSIASSTVISDPSAARKAGPPPVVTAIRT